MKTNCKFCGEHVDLENEGNTHVDGSVSHEGCSDGDTFERENAADLSDLNYRAGYSYACGYHD